MSKKYTLYDFLNATKYCINCSNLTNLNVYKVNDDRTVRTVLSFDVEQFNFIIKLKSAFNKKNSSFININSKTHDYSMSNFNKDTKLGFFRKCNYCNKYNLSSNVIALQNKMSPIQIAFIQVWFETKHTTYLLQQNESETRCYIVGNDNHISLPNIDLINIKKDDILKKINKYLIL